MTSRYKEQMPEYKQNFKSPGYMRDWCFKLRNYMEHDLVHLFLGLFAMDAYIGLYDILEVLSSLKHR
jgi:hypothetical protein